MVTEIPRKFHNTPEVLQAKKDEINNFQKFDAYKEVEDVGQKKITSRWVVTQKWHKDKGEGQTSGSRLLGR